MSCGAADALDSTEQQNPCPEDTNLTFTLLQHHSMQYHS